MFLSIILFLSLSISFAQDIYEGYILYTPGGIQQSNIISYLQDVNGDIYNYWSHSTGAASMPYLYPGEEPGFENTLLYYPCRSNNQTMITGGAGGRFEIYNWTGELLWYYEISDNTYQHHHDIDVLPNGNILAIAWERKYSSDWLAMGRTTVENSLNQMWSLAIFELEPNLDTGETSIVWEWHLWDHLIQNRDESYDAFYGNISEYPELMDINCGNVGTNGGPGGQVNADWMHTNAIDYNTELDQIVFSARHQNEIYIIDHSTTTEEASGHTGGNSNMGGDFLYRWGSPSNYDRGNSSDDILAGQHGVNWIENDCPGAGNLIIYNNQHDFNSSAVIEIETPIDNTNNYTINPNAAFGPADLAWMHQSNFFSDVQSGAFRVPNGNTIITDANDSYIFEVTQDGTVVWSYDYPSNNAMIPRAQKYSYNYFDSNSSLLGDVNEDGIINILDIVLVVNVILEQEYSPNADLNSDGIVNILDIVSLINVILSE